MPELVEIKSPLLKRAWPKLHDLSQKRYDPSAVFEELLSSGVISRVMLLRPQAQGLELRLAGDYLQKHFPETVTTKKLLRSLEPSPLVRWVGEQGAAALVGGSRRSEETFFIHGVEHLMEGLFVPLGGEPSEGLTPIRVLAVLDFPRGAPQ